MCLLCGDPTHVIAVILDDVTGTVASLDLGAAGTGDTTAPGGSDPSANGVFDIVIRYTGDPTYQAAFTSAVIRWTQIIIADIPDVSVSSQFQTQFQLPSIVDDLIIDATIEPIDGPGRILGSAGPDLVRSGSLLPLYGHMRFDVADVAGMFASGVWTDVILHEMGHILGIGTLWSALGLKNGAGDYIGSHALAEYRTLIGNPSASSIPIEHDGGSGTAGAHWNEETFNAELMTGFIESAGIPMAISRMTIGSLQDIGYTVNYAAADPYSLPGTINPPNPLIGDANDNVLVGTSNSETLRGFGGNDTLDGGTGNDSIDGGAGDDTALFAAPFSHYSVRDFGAFIAISGPDGNDTLISIEHLNFADGAVHIADGSALFDTLFYARDNLDVFQAGVNPLSHFNANGWHESRDPNPYFSTAGYLAANPDVRASGANPLTQYEQGGWRQNRDPGPDFDIRLYLQNNPDVAAAGIDPLAHFLQYGMAEGRVAYAAIGTAVAGFDAEWYVFHYSDVARAGVDPAAHYANYGWREGRNPNPLFDTAGYLSHYTDVAQAGMNPLQHYMLYGWREGRDPSAGFDTLKYLQAYGDVAGAGINPLQHFLNDGLYEHRQAFGDGIWHT